MVSMDNKRSMPVIAEKFAVCDPVWSDLREEAIRAAAAEPALASFVHATILNHERLEEALTYHLAQKLGNDDVGAMQVRQVFDQAFADEPTLGDEVRADLSAVYERDPSVTTYLQPFLFFKGFLAIQSYRVMHWLYKKGRVTLAQHFQSRVSEVFAVDVNPAAKIGRGVMIDHGTGVVIGETAVIEDDVSMLHGVTLGGTGKETGDRHPKVRRGVMIGANATILGNIEIGANSRVGAGSVVLADVPEHCTVAGVPARVVGCAGCDQPSHEMNQIIEDVPLDYQI
jgi:serine O-acetyltransferase